MILCYTCGKEANQRSESGVPFCNKCKLTHAAPKEEKTDFWPKVPKACHIEIVDVAKFEGTWWKIRTEGKLAMRVCKMCGWAPSPTCGFDHCYLCSAMPFPKSLHYMSENLTRYPVYYDKIAAEWMAQP